MLVTLSCDRFSPSPSRWFQWLRRRRNTQHALLGKRGVASTGLSVCTLEKASYQCQLTPDSTGLQNGDLKVAGGDLAVRVLVPACVPEFRFMSHVQKYFEDFYRDLPWVTDPPTDMELECQIRSV